MSALSKKGHNHPEERRKTPRHQGYFDKPNLTANEARENYIDPIDHNDRSPMKQQKKTRRQAKRR